MAIPLLDRYLWRHLRDIFLFGMAIFTVLLLINHFYFLANLVLGHGAPLSVALELLVLRMPYFLAFSFPMATLLAALMTVGRLSDGQEITAMRTGGISLTRIAASVVGAGVLISGLTLFFNEVLVPRAEDRYRRALDRAAETPASPVQEHVLFREVQESIEFVVYARRFRADTGIMEGVAVNQFERGRLRRVIEAPDARYLGSEWVFFNGTMREFTDSGTIVTSFNRLTLALRRTPKEIALPRRDPSEMTIGELRAYLRLVRRSGSGERTARYIVEIQSKFAVPASAALFALLAVPLGLRPHRSGPSIGVGLTILILVIYYIMISITLTLGKNARMHPVIAAWLPDLLLAAAGIVLLRRAEG
jgi:lipopolysaccharide export system permease protein